MDSIASERESDIVSFEFCFEFLNSKKVKGENMAFEYDQSEEAANNESNFLKDDGWFHFQVAGIDENPTKRDGSHLDALKVDCVVLAGTAENCIGKEFELPLWLPNLKQKNNGEFARKVLTRFFLAVGLLKEHKPGSRVSVETSDGIGRQFLAKLISEDQDGDPSKRRLKLSFSDIFHVDDPTRFAVACPKDLAAIAKIPAELRMDKAKFERIYGSHGQGTQNHGSRATSAPVASPPAAPAAAVNLDDF